MFKLTREDILTIGSSMQRRECVLTTKFGDLFCSDSRGGYNIVKLDGQSRFIKAIGAYDGDDSFITTPVGKCGDRAATSRPLTMHQAASPITMFGHRSSRISTRPTYILPSSGSDTIPSVAPPLLA